ncbi:MAG TPA: VanZ family protein [Flavobacterium sp.]|jgi:VanZ family protein
MTAKAALLLYTLFILAIFIMAYLHMLPLERITFYWFDSIGHFVLYGLWGYFFGRGFSSKIISLGNFIVPTGIVICMVIAVIEECMQAFSPYRSFTISDMGFSLIGILVAAVCLNFKKTKLT